jgi:(p)ppGpp synthase/HD superfamily hydrolase
MNFVATAKARTAIRNYLKKLRRGKAAELGKKMLDNALKEYSLSVRKISDSVMQEALEQLALQERSQLYEEIGLGERMAPLMARMLAPVSSADLPAKGSAPLTIAGTEGLVVTYGRCCNPIPEDAIFGYLSAGRGLVIHREGCGNLAEFRKQPEKWVAVEWEEELKRTFMVEIRAEVRNKLGVLAAVAANISAAETNIEHVDVVERDGDISSLTFLLQVRNRSHLDRVLRSIRSMPDVLDVVRTST